MAYVVVSWMEGALSVACRCWLQKNSYLPPVLKAAQSRALRARARAPGRGSIAVMHFVSADPYNSDSHSNRVDVSCEIGQFDCCCTGLRGHFVQTRSASTGAVLCPKWDLNAAHPPAGRF